MMLLYISNFNGIFEPSKAEYWIECFWQRTIRRQTLLSASVQGILSAQTLKRISVCVVCLIVSVDLQLSVCVFTEHVWIHLDTATMTWEFLWANPLHLSYVTHTSWFMCLVCVCVCRGEVDHVTTCLWWVVSAVDATSFSSSRHTPSARAGVRIQSQSVPSVAMASISARVSLFSFHITFVVNDLHKN